MANLRHAYLMDYLVEMGVNGCGIGDHDSIK
jgi:hypothetical protein